MTHYLYGGDWENRLKQEILLGIGGVRALQSLHIAQDVPLQRGSCGISRAGAHPQPGDAPPTDFSPKRWKWFAPPRCLRPIRPCRRDTMRSLRR